MIQTMTRIKKQYESKQELSKEEIQKRLNQRTEKSKYFGKSRCPSRFIGDDGSAQCRYTGIKDCGRPILNSIGYDDPEKDILFCTPKRRNYIDRI